MTKLQAISRIKEIQNGKGDRISDFPAEMKGAICKEIEKQEMDYFKCHDITFNYGFEYGEIWGLMKAFSINSADL